MIYWKFHLRSQIRLFFFYTVAFVFYFRYIFFSFKMAPSLLIDPRGLGFISLKWHFIWRLCWSQILKQMMNLMWWNFILPIRSITNWKSLYFKLSIGERMASASWSHKPRRLPGRLGIFLQDAVLFSVSPEQGIRTWGTWWFPS